LGGKPDTLIQWGGESARTTVQENAMKVVKTRSVDTALRTLDEDDRRVVRSWFDQLRNWENDEHLRKMTKPTVVRDTYSLNTPDDMRIYFKLNEAESEIEIVDLAKPSRFAAAGLTME
jgi:hypothetical protein